MNVTASAALRWALLGAARIADQAILPALRSLGSQVVALGCRDPSRGRAFAQRHGIPVVDSYEQVLQREDVDAVYIGLHNAAHVPWAVAALRQGKHVLCEKPLGTTADEVWQLRSVQAHTGLQVAEAFMYRFHPQIERAARIVACGEIGELRVMRGSFGFLLDRPDDARWDPALGGGSLYDVGCYPLSLMRLLSGHEPEVLAAHARMSLSGVDAYLHAVLRFGECLAHLDCGFEMPVLDHRFECIGTQGRLTLHRPFIAHGVATELELAWSDRSRTERFAPVDTYALMLAHFERAVRGEEAPRWTMDDAWRQAVGLEAVLHAAAGARTA